MRVLIVAVNYEPEPTGIAPYVTGLARGLLAAGHEPHVITGVPHYPKWRNYTGFTGLRRHEVIDGVPVTRVRHTIPDGGIGLGRVLLEVTFGLGVITSRWRKPDVILTVSPPLVASAAVLARARLSRRRPATALWSHDLYTRGMAELGDGRDSWKVRLARAVEGTVYRAADGIISVGARHRECAVGELRVPAGRVEVHHNWSHVHALAGADGAAFRAAHGWGQRPVVLHAGNMGHKQGLDAVVESARLAEREGSPVLFAFTGDGSERPRLEKLAGSCANVVFLDPLPDEEFAQALAAADILLVHEKPGVSEMALPSKLTTYFTAGKQVLAAVYPVGNTAALVEAAEAGKVVAPGDPRALLDAATAMAADPEQARVFGASARVYAQAHMESGAAVRGIIDFLASLTTGSRDVPAVPAGEVAQAGPASPAMPLADGGLAEQAAANNP